MNTRSIPVRVRVVNRLGMSSIALALSGISHAEDNDYTISPSKVQQGFNISPVPKAIGIIGRRA
jgi:hypothetical protein